MRFMIPNFWVSIGGCSIFVRFWFELQRLYPGLSLADVNLDSYKIVEEVRYRSIRLMCSFAQKIWFFSSCVFSSCRGDWRQRGEVCK